MNVFRKIILSSAVIGLVYAPVALAQSTSDYLVAKFRGRAGTATEDQRKDEHDLGSIFGPGPKTGCHGDTFAANVTINSVNVQMQNSTANITVTYSGSYTRQGWISPCVQSPPPNGHEDRSLSGTYHFSLTQRPFENVTLSWGSPENLGEVGDAGHMSNVFAIRAVQQAIQSAM
jgi:hypothetical protein